jgi:hypothetical protein
VLVLGFIVTGATVLTYRTAAAQGDKRPAATQIPHDTKTHQRFAFEMRDQTWAKVLEQLADLTGLPLVSEKAPPVGKFTHISPKDKLYTIQEVFDIVNKGLAPHKLKLVRRERSMTLVPTDDAAPAKDPNGKLDGKPAAKHDFTNLQRLATALENFNYPENTATSITVWCQGGGKGTSAQVTDARTLDVAAACHYIVDGHHDKKGLDLENVAVVSADGTTIRFVNIKEKFAANRPFGLNVNRGELVIVLQLRKD